MKKYIIVLIAVLVILTGCVKIDKARLADNPESEVTQPIQNEMVDSADDDKDSNDNTYFGQYQMAEEGFSQLVKDNAIDKDYAAEMAEFQKSAEFSTNGWIQLESKYSKLWDNELNSIYNILMEKLKDNEKKKLIEAQKGWLAFHIGESEFVSEAWDAFGLGSQGRVQMIMAEKSRLRERTLQLMEYYHMLAGDIEFIYESLGE